MFTPIIFPKIEHPLGQDSRKIADWVTDCLIGDSEYDTKHFYERLNRFLDEGPIHSLDLNQNTVSNLFVFFAGGEGLSVKHPHRNRHDHTFFQGSYAHSEDGMVQINGYSDVLRTDALRNTILLVFNTGRGIIVSSYHLATYWVNHPSSDITRRGSIYIGESVDGTHSEMRPISEAEICRMVSSVGDGEDTNLTLVLPVVRTEFQRVGIDL